MKLTKYNNYKNTNIQWLGDIPEHWEVKRTKDIAEIKGRIGFRGYTKEDFVEDNKGALVVGATEMNENGFILVKNPKYINWDKYYESPEIMLKSGNLLIVQRGSTVGKVAIVDDKLGISTINPSLVVLKKIRINNFFFLYYLLSSSVQEVIKSQTATTAIPMISQEQIGKYIIFIPPLAEQTAIANYLDQKTAQIDKKVDLLSQKIEKYKELKKSLINETVCRGLDKNVKLKPSGIDWIGDIPEHWEVKRFKEVCYKNTTGGTPKTSNEQHFLGENTWVTIRDVEDGKFIGDSKLKLTDEAVKEANISLTPQGSLIYSFKLSIGKIAFATKDLYTNEALISILPNKYIDLEYHYFMLPILLLLNATENIYGAKMLNQKLINNAVLLHPPLTEQTAIAQYLDEKTSKIDQITANLSQQIETLKELRKTLINEVVTGKVRVID